MTATQETQAKPMVLAEQVCKSFGALRVLKGVTLQVDKGQVLVLVGPSGSGKSTFLRCINHLEEVNAGRLYVDGVPLSEQSYEGTLNVTPAAPGWWGSNNAIGSPGAGAILKNTLVADRPFSDAEIQSLWEGH